jgi:phosphatidylethanolamine/phosphatidyl-N-methylethanolamine N-methyltransferase
MNENIEFLQAFLKNPGKVGSIAPSSPELAQTMLDGLRPSADNIIIELGVGTGAITKFLQDILPDDRSYLGIELDASLVRMLKKNLPDMNIVCGNAMEMEAIHQQSGLGNVGHIVCCLPFVFLPSEVRDGVLIEVDKFMDKGCEFRTLQYAHGYHLPTARKFRALMRKRYGREHRSQLVVKNVPPAYILTWSTKK